MCTNFYRYWTIFGEVIIKSFTGPFFKNTVYLWLCYHLHHYHYHHIIIIIIRDADRSSHVCRRRRAPAASQMGGFQWCRTGLSHFSWCGNASQRHHHPTYTTTSQRSQQCMPTVWRCTRLKFWKSGQNCMWPDISQHIWPELDNVIAAPLLCMLMTCMKLHNLCINCSVLMSISVVVVVAQCKVKYTHVLI